MDTDRKRALVPPFRKREGTGAPCPGQKASAKRVSAPGKNQMDALLALGKNTLRITDRNADDKTFHHVSDRGIAASRKTRDWNKNSQKA